MFWTAVRYALGLVFVAQVALATERVALVIGNSDYENVPRLENPVNDADDIAAALESAGFDVERQVDLGYEETRHALANFGARAAKAEVALIYFAGHGIEISRQNYLLPVDARLADPLDVSFQAMPLDLLQRAAEPAKRMSLVIIDACRNNPFVDRLETGTRSLSRGLSTVTPRGKNRLVAFAAKEGTIAEDGDGRNSPYAAALKLALAEPGLEIGKLFRKVRDDVMARTGGRQEPSYYGSLTSEDFYFVPPAPEPAAPAQSQPGQGPQDMAEVAFWLSIAESEDARDFADYLSRYPDGQFADLAQRRLAKLLRGDIAMAPPQPPTAAPGASDASGDGSLTDSLLNPGAVAPADASAAGQSSAGGFEPPHPEFSCVPLAGGSGCVQPSPVSFERLTAFVDAASAREPGVRTSARAVEPGFNGVAENVPHWLAKRFAAWESGRLGIEVCVASSAAVSTGAKLPANRFEPATFREVTSDLCQQYPSYSSNVIVEGNPAGDAVARCLNEFTALPGQVFRLMHGAVCR